jgi:bifunctional non-homologous end joining protein LigD
MEEPLQPMEPVLWLSAFDDPAWQFELKWDGVRCLTYADGDAVRLYGRRGSRWSDRFPELQAALQGSDKVLDGELVVLQDGQPSFPAMMRRLHKDKGPVHFMAFDCLASGGRDLRREPLAVRREVLLSLRETPIVHRVDAVPGAGRSLFKLAQASGLEGIVAKRYDAGYVGGKSGFWRKVKCWRHLRCLVLGIDEAKGEIRSVRLGLQLGGTVVPVGSVGNLAAGEQEALRQALAYGPAEVDVSYLYWTEDGNLRHPRWQGIIRGGAGH